MQKPQHQCQDGKNGDGEVTKRARPTRGLPELLVCLHVRVRVRDTRGARSSRSGASHSQAGHLHHVLAAFHGRVHNVLNVFLLLQQLRTHVRNSMACCANTSPSSARSQGL